MTEAPLSFGQEFILGALRRSGAGCTRTLSMSIGLVGELDVVAFVAALRKVVADNDALRASLSSFDGGPHQVLLPVPDDAALVSLEMVLADSEEQFQAYAISCFEQVMNAPYDPVREYPFKFVLFRRTPAHHVLIGVFSHIFLDGHSLALLPSRIMAEYEDGGPRPDTSVSFFEAARRQRRRYGARAAERNAPFWRELIRSMPVRGQFGETAGSAADGEEATIRFLELPAAGVRSACEVLRVSVFQLVTWALVDALLEWTPQDKLAVHLAADTRDLVDRDVLGSFAQVLPSVVGRQAATLHGVQRAVLETVFHRHVPGEVVLDAYQALAEAWGVPRRPTVMVSEQKLMTGEHMSPDRPVLGPPLTVQLNPVRPKRMYVEDGVNLVLAVFPEHLAITIAFHPGLFADEMILRITSAIEHRVRSAGHGPEPEETRAAPRPMPPAFCALGPAGDAGLMWADPAQTTGALLLHPSVTEAEVVAVDGPAGTFLHADVRTRLPVSADELRSHVAALSAGRQFLIPPRTLDITVDRDT